jgi:hypothetical protein
MISYTDSVICTEPDRILETWPPIYRGQELARDRLRLSQLITSLFSSYIKFRLVCLNLYLWVHPMPLPPILSPSSRTSTWFYNISSTNQREATLSLLFTRLSLENLETIMHWHDWFGLAIMQVNVFGCVDFLNCHTLGGIPVQGVGASRWYLRYGVGVLLWWNGRVARGPWLFSGMGE